ncbi:hypothetical protein [Kaistella sp.]|uniref:hypothetical protein n=2 Tax=Kaistella sp. TaxID=2782235 RepID=UPI0035A14AF0
MSENLHLVLIILAFLILMSWTFYSMFKTKRKIKSSRFSEKKQGVQELKNLGNENAFQVVAEVILKFLSKLF